jgi:hypothetical protein
MKRAAAPYLIFALLLASPAGAQVKIDLDSVTCQQFLEMPRDRALIMAGWLQNYFLEDDAEPTVDFEKALADLQRLADHCKTELDDKLVAAAEDVFGRQAPTPPAADNPAPPR